jgi:hypothetical protein
MRAMASAPKKSSNTWIVVAIVAIVVVPILCGVGFVVVGGAVSFFSLSPSSSEPVRVSPTVMESPGTFSIRYAMERYQIDVGTSTCPTAADLESRGLLMPGQSNDEWGHPWTITCAGMRWTATSNGPDGAPGTSDDVTATVGN